MPNLSVTEPFNDAEFIGYPIPSYRIFGDAESVCYRIVRSP